MSIKDHMPSRERLRQKIETGPDLDYEVCSPMTMEEAIELGKSDNEANWDNPVRLMAYRIRTGLTPTPENPNG